MSLAVAALLVGSAQTENPPRIEVDPSDNPLLIKGFIGEEPGLLGAMRLRGVQARAPFAEAFYARKLLLGSPGGPGG